MTANEQLQKWVAGESVHNNDVFLKSGKKLQGGECCPDFSCCKPGMKWPKEKREAFAKAELEGDDVTKHKMLTGALGQLMDYEEKRKVVIIG